MSPLRQLNRSKALRPPRNAALVVASLPEVSLARRFLALPPFPRGPGCLPSLSLLLGSSSSSFRCRTVPLVAELLLLLVLFLLLGVARRQSAPKELREAAREGVVRRVVLVARARGRNDDALSHAGDDAQPPASISLSILSLKTLPELWTSRFRVLTRARPVREEFGGSVCVCVCVRARVRCACVRADGAKK